MISKITLPFPFVLSIFPAIVFQESQSGGTEWIWFVMIILILIVLGYLLIRQVTSGSTESVQATQAATITTDDLTILEGVGPKVASVLQKEGITTFSQLAKTSQSRLEEILKAADFAFMDPGTWPEQARLAAAGDMEGLKKLQDQLKGGRAA